MSERPNFLILLSDQQRYDTICAAGYPHMKTPNLDRLAQEGCVFTNAYSPNPVCMPARHYLMTGTTARFHGYFGNVNRPIQDDGLPTLPRVLSDNGYFTAAVGKMHFHPPTRHHGFNQMHLMEELPEHRDDDAYATYLKDEGYDELRNIHGVRPLIYHEPQESLMPEEHHGCNWVSRKAIDVLEKNKGRPFFMMCGWIKPHPPWNIPPRWMDTYKDADLPEPIERSRDFPYYEGESDWFGDNDSPERKRAIREAYYTSVSMVDNSIGPILKYLESTGQLDNTFIIFTSDHGEMLQDKGMYQKAVPFDSAAKVPFVVRYPKSFKPGTRDEKFVDLMDIFPTMLEAAGIDYQYKESNSDYQLAGGSFLPESSVARDRDYQRADYRDGVGRWVMLRDSRYKYVYFYNDGTEHFYDLQDDPQELNNLIKSGDVPQADYERLRKKCVEMEAELGPQGYVENGDFIKFDRRELDPTKDSDCSNPFPLWANMQFQKFGDKDPAYEAALYVDEIKHATAHCGGEEFLKNVAPAQEWKDGWFENFEKLGGDERGRREVIGE